MLVKLGAGAPEVLRGKEVAPGARRFPPGKEGAIRRTPTLTGRPYDLFPPELLIRPARFATTTANSAGSTGLGKWI